MQTEYHQHRSAQMLTDKEVGQLLRMSKSSVWSKSKNEPDFPKGIKLSPGATRWKLIDVEAFIESKAQTTH